KMTASEVRADLDGLEIGIRNLIINGGFEEGTEDWTTVDGESHTIMSTGFLRVSKDQGQEGNVNLAQSRSIEHPWTMENNKRYTLSFLLYSRDLDSSILGIRILGTNKNIALPNIFELVNHGQVNDGIGVQTVKARLYSVTFYTTQGTIEDARLHLIWRSPVNDVNRNLYIRDIMLVEGNKMIRYIPAPEDTDEAINQVSGRVETLDASVTTLAGEVSLKASQSIVDSLEGRVSTAEGELSVLPGEINAKVNRDGVIGAIN